MRGSGNEFNLWLRTLPEEIASQAELAGRPFTCPDPGTDHGRALLQTLGVEIEKPKPKPKRRIHRCSTCGRRLKTDHWIYSRFTHARYCWPGEGCNR